MDRNELPSQGTRVNVLLRVCLYENYDDDLNKDYVSNWEERAIEGKPTRAVVAQQQESRPCL